VPNFQGLERKSRKSSNSSIGIDPNKNKLYDYINEKEERDKNPIYEIIEDDDNPTYEQENDLSFGEDQAFDHEDEEENIPQVPAKKKSSPMKEPVEQGEQKSMKKIKKLKDKFKTLKVLERFLKNENALLKERNHTFISENEKLKEDTDQLREEHELVFHQAYLWNKSIKALKKQNWKLQVKVQIYKRRAQPHRPRPMANVEVLLRAVEAL
jgi:FtsZ-binding cell division protein ZapB